MSVYLQAKIDTKIYHLACRVKFSADNILKYFFLKIGFVISCKLSSKGSVWNFKVCCCFFFFVLFFSKNKKNIINLSSADLAHRVICLNA